MFSGIAGYEICFASSWLPEPHLINLQLLGGECKPIIIRDADKALHLLPQKTLSNLCTNVSSPFRNLHD
jgi:hypothetical protein